MTEQEYRDHSALNYSTLASLDRNPENLLIKDRAYDKALTMGGAVDALITDNKSFREVYCISDVHYPSDSIKQIIDKLPDKDIIPLEQRPGEILAIAKEMDYGQSWKSSTLTSKVYEQGLDYYKFLVKAKDKKVLSLEEYNSCSTLVNIILSHEFTGKHFMRDNDIDILFQYPIIFKYPVNNQEYKCKLDMIRIDHTKKTIHIYDIKTTSDKVSNFSRSVLKWRYDIQASLYNHAAIYHFKLDANAKYKDYDIKFLKFIVGSFQDNKVLVYNSKNIFELGRDGGETKSGKRFKGWLELTDIYKWHTTNEKYSYSKEVYDNSGELMLEIL